MIHSPALLPWLLTRKAAGRLLNGPSKRFVGFYLAHKSKKTLLKHDLPVCRIYLDGGSHANWCQKGRLPALMLGYFEEAVSVSTLGVTLILPKVLSREIHSIQQ